jgi:hypothetical protein
MEHVRWRKSSFSGYLECVELAHSLREVRDSKNPTGPVLTVDLDGLLAAVKRGDLDADGHISEPSLAIMVPCLVDVRSGRELRLSCRADDETFGDGGKDSGDQENSRRRR